MQDANTQAWTESKARAETVALGKAGGDWVAPIPADQAFGAKLGPKDTAIAAYINHGRWVVECPDCCGAQFACPDDPRFMCNNCANAMNDGMWRPVLWIKDRAKIEVLLKPRPVENQNWRPGETLADLKAENKQFGVAA